MDAAGGQARTRCDRRQGFAVVMSWVGCHHTACNSGLCCAYRAITTEVRPSTKAVALAPSADRNQASDLLHETARADDLAQPPQDTDARLPPKLHREMAENIAEGAGIGKAQRGLGRGEVLFCLDHPPPGMLRSRIGASPRAELDRSHMHLMPTFRSHSTSKLVRKSDSV